MDKPDNGRRSRDAGKPTKPHYVESTKYTLSLNTDRSGSIGKQKTYGTPAVEKVHTDITPFSAVTRVLSNSHAWGWGLVKQGWDYRCGCGLSVLKSKNQLISYCDKRTDCEYFPKFVEQSSYMEADFCQ